MELKEENPKGILVLDDIKARSAKWEKDYDPDGEFQILSIEELKNLPIKFDKGKPKIGQIYIQHPYQNNLYIKPDIAPGDFEKIRLNQLAQLYAILGAKLFKTILINREESQKSKEGGLKVTVPVGGLEVGAMNSIGSLVSNSYELEIEFEGSYPQYEQALSYALETGLDRDNKIWELIQKRNPEHNNLAKRYREKINLSKEINENLAIGLNLNVFAGRLNIETKYSSQVLKKEIIELEIVVEF